MKKTKQNKKGQALFWSWPHKLWVLLVDLSPAKSHLCLLDLSFFICKGECFIPYRTWPGIIKAYECYWMGANQQMPVESLMVRLVYDFPQGSSSLFMKSDSAGPLGMEDCAMRHRKVDYKLGRKISFCSFIYWFILERPSLYLVLPWRYDCSVFRWWGNISHSFTEVFISGFLWIS